MNDLLKLLLSISLSGGIVALILLACKPLLKNRMGRVWHYYIWLLVVVRLLVPLSPQTSLMSILFTSAPPPAVEAYGQKQMLGSEKIPSNIPNAETENTVQLTKPATGIVALNGSSAVSTVQGLAILWLVLPMVSIIFALYKTIAYLLFLQRIKHSCHRTENAAILDSYQDACKLAGITKPPPQYECTLLSTPMLVGVLRPIILLPQNAAGNLTYTLLHELIHFKRRDTLYKWLMQFTLCLHWFNPAVWLAAREMGKDCELSCDEAVLKLAGCHPKQYGDTLLANISRSNSNIAGSLPLSEGGRTMKARLEAIKSFDMGNRPKRLFVSILTAILVFTAVFMGCAVTPKAAVAEPKQKIAPVATAIPTGSSTSSSPIVKDSTHSAGERYVQQTMAGDIYGDRQIQTATDQLGKELYEAMQKAYPNGLGARATVAWNFTLDTETGKVVPPAAPTRVIARKFTLEGESRKIVPIYEAEPGEDKVRKEQITIDLANRVLFPAGESELVEGDAQTLLENISEVLKYNGYKLENITVESYSNDAEESTTHTDNLDLSSMRAHNIARFLSEQSSVQMKLFTSLGRANFFPEEYESSWEQTTALDTRIIIELTDEAARKKI